MVAGAGSFDRTQPMYDHSVDGGGELIVDHSFDPTTTDPVDAVFAAVSRTDRVDLTDATPLASVVDPDALSSLFKPAFGHDVHVRFRYEGLMVELTGGGTVLVRDGREGTSPGAGRRHGDARSPAETGQAPDVDAEETVDDGTARD